MSREMQTAPYGSRITNHESRITNHESRITDFAVELERVACSVDAKKEVLTDVSLQVRRGEIVCVLGVSGVGKSTLLKVIAGLLPPSRGVVRVLGINITGMSEEELDGVRKRIGMVFQGAALFDYLTVGENVAFGLRQHRKLSEGEIQRQVDILLDAVGMNGTKHLLPNQLSGGMKKRVGIARALALEPELVLYDEPTSGLDPIVANIINDLIIRLRDKFGVTSVVVTHDLQSAQRIADRMAMLHDGKILACGTPEEFMQSDDPAVQQFLRGESQGPLSVSELIADG